MLMRSSPKPDCWASRRKPDKLMAFDVPNQDTWNRGAGSDATNYYLYHAANSDPNLNALARGGASMFGGGESLIKDILMLLQSMATVENGGVAMAQNLRAGVMRGGIMGIMAPGGQTGMVNGMDVASQQAANAMQQQIMRNFTNPVTGYTNHRAAGLDAAELGRLGGYMLNQGIGLNNGPMFQGELLDAQRIKDLQAQAAATTGSRREEMMRDASRLKVGQLHLSSAEGMSRFSDMMEDGAETLKAIKDVFGSAALKDLDDTFQQLLGGSLAEVGPRAARARMMGIKTLGTTFFGGDMQAAGTYSLGNQFGGAMSLGAALGVDPTAAKEMFGKLFASIAPEADVGGLVGDQGQKAAAAMAAKFGVGMHTAGAAEISAANQRDMGAITAENSEALALVALQQRTSATMSPDAKKHIAGLLSTMSGASTAEEQNSIRAEMEAYFQHLTGTSTGNDIANRGGQAKLMAGLSGNSARQFMKANWDDLQQRNQNILRENLLDEADQNGGLGMGRAGYVAFGMDAANLSNEKAFKIQQAMELSGAARQAKLAELGLSGQFMGQLMNQNNGGIFAQIRAGVTQYDGLENFIGSGQVAESRARMFQDWIAKNQYSDATNPDDFSTGLIRGMLGGKAMTGRDVLERARRMLLTPAELSLTDGKIDATKGNADTLLGVLGAKGRSEFGLTNSEDALAFLQDPDNLQSLYGYLGANGSYGIKGGKLSILGAEDTERGKRALEDITHQDLLGRMGYAKANKFERKKDKDGNWESDEDFTERFSTEVINAAREMTTKQGPGDNANWSMADDLIKKMSEGDEAAAATYNAMVGGGAMEHSGVRKEWLKSTNKLLTGLAEEKKAGFTTKDGKRVEGLEFERYAAEKEANLNNIRDKLLDSDTATINTETTNITANTVTVTGKVE
jgi:hypothetical protein